MKRNEQVNKLQTILFSDCRNKNYNFMIYGRNFFDQPVRNYLITYDIIQTIATGKGDYCTTGCLLV